MFRIVDIKGREYVIEGKDHQADWQVFITREKTWHPILRLIVTKRKGWILKKTETVKLIAEKEVIRRDFKKGTQMEIAKSKGKKAKLYKTTIKRVLKK